MMASLSKDLINSKKTKSAEESITAKSNDSSGVTNSEK